MTVVAVIERACFFECDADGKCCGEKAEDEHACDAAACTIGDLLEVKGRTDDADGESHPSGCHDTQG